MHQGGIGHVAVGILLHDLQIQLFGGLKFLSLFGNLTFAEQRMWLADVVSVGDNHVKQGDGFVFSLLVNPIINTSQAVEFHACRVHFKIVLYDQRERHGIVGDEFRGGGFQHLQLALGPLVFADEIAQLGVLETGFVAKRLFFHALVDLTV